MNWYLYDISACIGAEHNLDSNTKIKEFMTKLTEYHCKMTSSSRVKFQREVIKL
jgi:hypothetical protein